MSKKTITTCDICRRDISDDWQYRFRMKYRFHNWNYRTGIFHRYHICQKCLDAFEEYVKKNNEVTE